jgi:adenylate cyclase
VILADTSQWTRVQHTLTQQRNESSLLKQSLLDTNQRLEFILQRYVPQEVSHALLEKRILPELGGELRHISILFADLRNFTSTSEKYPPNEIMEVLHVCMDIATTAIAEAGGVVVNFMGDAVMALFNAPNEQPDHAKRAVKAGLTILAMMRVNQAQSNKENANFPFYFGVGINTGTALVGNVGAQWHYQYTAIGDSVNVASRICSHARAGELLIGPETYEQVQADVIANPLAPIKFKGKSQEVTIYQIMHMTDHYLPQQLMLGENSKR